MSKRAAHHNTKRHTKSSPVLEVAAAVGTIMDRAPQVMSVAEALTLLPPRRPKRYQVVYDALRKLTPGKSVIFTKDQLPAKVDVPKLARRLSIMLMGENLKAPKGHSFYKKVGMKGELIVHVLPSRKRRKAAKK